jgi:hypothetical protein
MIAEREWRDGREEAGIQSVHVAPFSPLSRITHYGFELSIDASHRRRYFFIDFIVGFSVCYRQVAGKLNLFAPMSLALFLP